MKASAEIIEKAESFGSIRASIVSLKAVLKAPSHRAVSDDPTLLPGTDGEQSLIGRLAAGTVLVLGLKHPPEDPRLDWWESGDSWGNRRLREISEQLKKWLDHALGLQAHPLPYHLEKGGIFLKDAAVLSGMGIIGRSNLLLHPQWGPRIRLRSILIEEDLPTTAPIDGFDPCSECEGYCQKACPVHAFPEGAFSRNACYLQMNADVNSKVAEGETDQSGSRAWVIKYCRACEMACPVGK